MSELPPDHAKLWLAATFGGLSKHISKRADIEIPPGTTLMLVREPHNPHDPSAIQVVVHSDALSAELVEKLTDVAGFTTSGAVQRWHLGYLPGPKGDFNWSAALAPLIDAGGVVEAALSRFGSKKHNICVVLSGEPIAKARELGAPAEPA